MTLTSLDEPCDLMTQQLVVVDGLNVGVAHAASLDLQQLVVDLLSCS